MNFYPGDFVAVVGSRQWPRHSAALVRQFVTDLPPGCTVVSGGAAGVDSWAEDQARNEGLSVVVFKPEWKDADGRFNKAAGFERNNKIVALADVLVAFSLNRSAGTANSILHAEHMGIPILICEMDTHSQVKWEVRRER